MTAIVTALGWTAAVCACWYFGCELIRQVPADHDIFTAPKATRATQAKANPELIEALTKLGHTKATAKQLAAKVDPDLDVEIALQVIYSEYGEL